MDDDMEQLLEKGVDAKKFWNLFVQCTQCRIVMPRHYYPYQHPCAVKVYEGTMERHKATFRELQRRLRAEEAEANGRRQQVRLEAVAPSDAESSDSSLEGGQVERQGGVQSQDDDAGSEASGFDSELESLPSDPYVAMFGPRP